MRHILMAALLSFAAPAVAQEAVPGPIGAPAGPARAQLHWVPYPAAPASRQTLLLMRVCRPPGDAAVKLAMINHGSPPAAENRPKMEPTTCEHEVTRWFLARGFAVAYPMRRGYGRTGGPWHENYGRCDTPDFRRAGLTSANDVQAAIAYAQALPFVRKDATLVVGQSAGGWASVALASRNPKNVAGIVNFAGGRGGRQQNLPHNNCAPEALAAAAGGFGATSRFPMLWVYTPNDTYFRRQIVEAMHAAFAGAGAPVRFEMLPPFPRDGHFLFFGAGGTKVWGPSVERYLTERGLS